MFPPVKIPFGIRNNNPGNLVFTPEEWQGLADPSSVVNESSGRKFFCFKGPCFGIRAIAVTLKTYYDLRLAENGTPIDTVAEICQRWDAENSSVYAGFVLGETGIAPGQIIDLHDPDVMEKLVRAIIKFENGSVPYTDAQIHKGLMMAGVEKDAKPLKKSRTIHGSIITAGSAAIVTATEYAQEAISNLGPVMDILRALPVPRWVVFTTMFLGVAWVVMARIDDRKRGLR